MIWHRRENNRIADFIVNHTMDRGSDCFHRFDAPIQNFSIHEANLLCHSDGGTRVGKCSATGWIVEAIVVRGDAKYTFPLAMAGKFLQKPISSFTVETLALDEAIDYIHKLLF